MDFSDALKEIKQKRCMTRSGWNGKDMFVFLVPGSEFQVNRPPLNEIFPDGHYICYSPHIDIKSVDGKISTWVPSINDLMAEDWEVK